MTVLSALIFIYVKYPDIFFNKLVTLLKPHQQSRILGWLDPFQHTDQGYQTQQSLLAVGSGGRRKRLRFWKCLYSRKTY